MQHAIVSKKDAMIISIEKDDGNFEIKFRVDKTNYDYDIDHYGNILDFDIVKSKSDDVIYTSPTYYNSGVSRYSYSSASLSGATKYIDLEDMISENEVESLVLEHAGVNKEDTRITKFKRDDYGYSLKFNFSCIKSTFHIKIPPSFHFTMNR